MTNTNLLEKYNLLKSALTEANMVNSVKLALTETQATEFIINAQGRIVIIQASSAQIASTNNQIILDIIVADKVNSEEVEEYILNSWTNSLSLLRYVADLMNYADNENIVFSEVRLDVSDRNDMERENIVATAYTQIEMSFDVVPNIFIERVNP